MNTLTTLDLTTVRGVIFDMDGVLWRDTEVMPDAAPFLNFLRGRGIPVQVATNNSTRTVSEYIDKCRLLGLPIAASEILSSSLVTLDYLQRGYPVGSAIYVIGSPSLSAIYAEAGYRIDPDADSVRAVIVGMDRELSYEKLKIAFRCLQRGAEFLATNADATFPAADGLTPGAGSIVAALEKAIGYPALVMGKPQPAIFQVAVARLGCLPGETLMIGDRLDTDIIGAAKAGLRTALVLTGISRREDIGAIEPDGVYPTLADLHGAWLRERA